MVVGAEPDVSDTHWMRWAGWAPKPEWDRATNLESWGNGQFFGLYPTTERVMCCAGFHKDHIKVEPTDLDKAKAFMRERFQPLIESDPQLGGAIDDADRLFPWPMTDVRAKDWVKGRVLLCGDAAVGFMPTAGAGANTAMRSAASLADELSRINGEIARWRSRCTRSAAGRSSRRTSTTRGPWRSTSSSTTAPSPGAGTR
jgi:2-polyprenyl-6-methoxyphenol hydroxylase-like FAD-dependent oxidoreductase